MPALTFQHGRLLVGRSYNDFQPVWYAPVAEAEDNAKPLHKIGLYWRSRGHATGRDPLYDAVAWDALWNPAHIHCKGKPTQQLLHEQLLHDVHNYLSNKDDDLEPDLLAKMEGSGTSGLHIAVTEAAVKVREQKQRAKQRRKMVKARAEGKRLDEVESESSDDSGFESGGDDAGGGGSVRGGPSGSSTGGGGGGGIGNAYDDANSTWSGPETGRGSGRSRGSMAPPPPRNKQYAKTLRRGQRLSSSATSSTSSTGRKRPASSISEDFQREAIGGNTPTPSFSREGSLGTVRDSVESTPDPPPGNGSEHRKFVANFWQRGAGTGLIEEDDNDDEDMRKAKELSVRTAEEETEQERREIEEAMRLSVAPDSQRRTLGGPLPQQTGYIDLDAADDADDGQDGGLPTPDPSQQQPANMQAFFQKAEAERARKQTEKNARDVNGDRTEEEAHRQAIRASQTPQPDP